MRITSKKSFKSYIGPQATRLKPGMTQKGNVQLGKRPILCFHVSLAIFMLDVKGADVAGDFTHSSRFSLLDLHAESLL